ncbi:MAG: hypothetical protein JNL70_03830 [Saprospiraceae bacterium]|nr:hypothetical protein [Saprospiraceae bacterium]
MGVTIHYRGKLKSPELIPDIVHEVEEICLSNNWSFRLINDPSEGQKVVARGDIFVSESIEPEFGFDIDEHLDKLRGITFEPHKESETVTFLFDTEGVMHSLFPDFFSKAKYPWSFVKTQYAGVETHIRIINLMRYLKKKYFSKFEIRDEGGYYPYGNEAELQERFDYLNNAMATVHDIFDNMDIDNAASPDDFINHLKNALSASFKGSRVEVIKIDPLSMMSDMMKHLNEETDPDVPKKKKNRKKKDNGDE